MLGDLHRLVNNVSRRFEIVFVHRLQHDPVDKAVSRIILSVVQGASVKNGVRVAIRLQRELVLETLQCRFRVFALFQRLCFGVPVPAIFAGNCRRNRFLLRFAQLRREGDRKPGGNALALGADDQHFVDRDEQLGVDGIRLGRIHGRAYQDYRRELP